MVQEKRVQPAFEAGEEKEKMTVTLTCPFCSFSKELQKEKIPQGVKWATCPRCRWRFEFRLTEKDVLFVYGEETGAEFQREKDHGKTLQDIPVPWENRSEIGLWRGILQTFMAVLFSPRAFFSNKAFKNGIWDTLAFGILADSFGIMFKMFWCFLVFAGVQLSLGDYIFGQALFSHFTLGLVFIITMSVIPILVTLNIFVWSGILHLLLLVVRGGGNGYMATFNVVSYSQAAQAFNLAPFVGGWIGWIWRTIIQIIGLREIHNTSYLRIITAFLIPLLLFFFLIPATLILLVFVFAKS